jgi:hypothetical protein
LREQLFADENASPTQLLFAAAKNSTTPEHISALVGLGANVNDVDEDGACVYKFAQSNARARTQVADRFITPYIVVYQETKLLNRYPS